MLQRPPGHRRWRGGDAGSRRREGVDWMKEVRDEEYLAGAGSQ
jgi:hypothetical protein